jgi:translocation and assembly module TamB
MILVIFLMIMLQFSIIQKILINYFVTELNQSIAGKISFAEFEGNLLHHFKLKNVKLSHLDQSIITFKQLELQYSPLGLLRQQLKVQKLKLVNPQVNLSQKNNLWNIIAAFESGIDTSTATSSATGDEFNWEISIAAFHLDSGYLQIESDSVLIFEKSITIQDLYLKCNGFYTSRTAELIIDDLRFQATRPDFHLNFLKTKVIYHPEQIKIDYFQLKTDSSLFETNGLVKLSTPLNFSIQGRFKPLYFKDFQQFFPDISFFPSSQMDFTAQGKLDRLAANLNLTTKNQKISLNGSWINQDTLNPQFSLTGRTSKLNLADLTGNPRLNSQITGNISLAGKGLRLPEMTLKAELKIDSTSHLNRHTFANSHISAQLAHEKFELNGRIGFGDGFLFLKGQAHSLSNLPQYRIKLLARNFPLHQLVDFNELSDPLNAKVSVEGVGFTPAEINTAFHASIDSNCITGIPFRSIELEGHWRKQDIAIGKGKILSPLANFNMDGHIRLDSSIAINYELMLKNLTLLPDTLLPGDLKIDGQIQGQVTGRWDSLIVTGLTNFPTFSYDNYSGKNFRLQFKNTINLMDDNPVLTANAEFHGEIGTIQFDSDLQIDATNFTGSYRNNELLNQFKFERHPGQSILLHTGTQLADTIQIRIDSLEIQYAHISLKNSARAFITYLPDDFIQIENFQLGSDSTIISADGLLPFEGDQHLDLLITNFDLNLLAPWFPDYPATGMLNVKTSVDGTFESPLIASNIRLIHASFKTYPFDSLQVIFLYGNQLAKFNLKLVVEELKARFISSGQVDANLAFVTEDSIRLHEINELKIQCQNWELDFLNILIPEVEKIAGRLSIDVALNNLMTQPKGTGTIRLEKGQLKIPETGVIYQDVELNGSLNGNEFQLQNISLKAPEGTLNGQAFVDWQGFKVQNFNANLKMDQFLVMDTDLFRSKIQSDLRLWGNPDSQRIAGDLTVLSSRLNLPPVTTSNAITQPDFNISPDSIVVDSVRLQQEVLFPEIPFIKNLRGAVKIKIPRNSWIRNDMLNVEYSGDLTLVKESPDFALFGTADVVRGTVNVYGRQFEIEKGSINFRGEPYPNPALYIIATHKIRQQNTESLRIQVIVGGTALIPQLTLQSEPYLEQKDIISYLVFGKPFDFLTSGELKEMNGTYSEKMGAILVGIAARQLSQVIARQLNLDIVEFDLSQESNSAGFKVGKYLNDELFVLYTQDLKTQENQSLMIEYQLNKYLSIRASRTRKGDKEEQGIDVFYKKEW